MFDALEKALDANLQELTDCLDFVSASFKLRPRLGDYVNWPATEGSPRQIIRDFLDSVTGRIKTSHERSN